MEDEVVVRPGSLLEGFSFAAVFDGHAGFSAVQFLRHPDRSGPRCPRVARLPLAAAGAGGGAAGLRCCGRAGSAYTRCHATVAGTVAAGPPSSELEAIRWGSAKLQGARDEMEDEVVVRPGSLLEGFSFAAVFDGHAGFSAVQFLRHPDRSGR
ncbi:hypothetical protein GUJ93_ZPchr0001g30977 [Zizania palustris]|uniref:Uncharacterized protein n=1 Tax=Zizania palustris TaxID=103762 RepID=A0A8J5S7X4_ZIZPA|nr:hypothetical protein GUJ93_ZPchr0001g30977 [Zizania palustris]